jgi:hypothetical protein
VFPSSLSLLWAKRRHNRDRQCGSTKMTKEPERQKRNNEETPKKPLPPDAVFQTACFLVILSLVTTLVELFSHP